ncbi:DDRGK1 [Cordylochernes scorpioides]|uniref:DDRGK domain-containing protein 1 n=1 Tax=Cordylochernes scorpioides TaxID=51811 RepID=A0ABY6LHP3_9ARAC|nr:DDRGK1 [Cordylochernes scorpioides]
MALAHLDKKQQQQLSIQVQNWCCGSLFTTNCSVLILTSQCGVPGPAAAEPIQPPQLAERAARGPRRPARDARARMRVAARRQEEEELVEVDDEMVMADELADYDVADEIALPEGKIGAKKRKKLEMKAEKRLQREQETQEREERKQREARMAELRRQDDLKQQELEKQKCDLSKVSSSVLQEEEEKRQKEEKEKQEYEEYLKLKATFVVDEEGFEETPEEEGGNKFQEFLNHLKTQKVVFLEDLAFKFKMKTQDALDRLQLLLQEQEIQGVLDDRGKFICIEPAELDAVARFINQRGHVSFSELSDSSHTLVSLQAST